MHRLCPGKYLAQELVFTVIATVLATFNVRKAKDADGNEITPIAEYTHGSIMCVSLPLLIFFTFRSWVFARGASLLVHTLRQFVA